jgi:SNF2 family DNA or RNA helicase
MPTRTSYYLNELKCYDVILTTYGIVRCRHAAFVELSVEIREWARLRLPFAENLPRKQNIDLFDIDWWCIILDEGHNVSNQDTATSAAACSLTGKYRIPLTATPLQNEYTDYHGLLKFMHLQLWSDKSTFTRVRILYHF